jgi:5-methyltetrahydrofolate--homocysteine methyltransferase
MLNSITLEGQRFERMLPLAREFRTKVVALCQGEGVATTAQQKIDTASRLVERLTAAGVVLADIYVDPLVFPLATDPASGTAALDALREITRRFPGVHTICGLTNVSHGLPARKLVNRAFLVSAMGAGLDAAILDPTDRELMAGLYATEAVLGRDEYCLGYLKAFRAGKLA